LYGSGSDPLSCRGHVACCEGKGGPIPEKNLLAIFIKEVRVDPRTFISRDLGPNREGVIELTLSGQSTVIPFSGAGPVNQKYLRRVAYLGRNLGYVQDRQRGADIFDSRDLPR